MVQEARSFESFMKTLKLSLILGFSASLFAFLSLDVSDLIFQSRLLPWIAPLIHVQTLGFHAASRFFPCQKEGFDTGCESFKVIPAILFTNAIVYVLIFTPVVQIYRTLKSRGSSNEKHA